MQRRLAHEALPRAEAVIGRAWKGHCAKTGLFLVAAAGAKKRVGGRVQKVAQYLTLPYLARPCLALPAHLHILLSWAGLYDCESAFTRTRMLLSPPPPPPSQSILVQAPDSPSEPARENIPDCGGNITWTLLHIHDITSSRSSRSSWTAYFSRRPCRARCHSRCRQTKPVAGRIVGVEETGAQGDCNAGNTLLACFRLPIPAICLAHRRTRK